MKMRTTKNRMYMWGFIFSICMIVASIMMLPTKAYAADDNIIATILVNEGNNFDVTAEKAYYKDDGSAGTSSNYNFYYNGSKLYVKDADVFQIYTKGENVERHLEFIGESTVNDFYADEAKVYIEGTANSKINIGDCGLYSENNYIGINNANIAINSNDNTGIITNNLEISNSNVAINANGAEGISSKNVAISNSNLKINASNDSHGYHYSGIECYTCTVNNSVLNITGAIGISGEKLVVTGGKLTVDGEDAGIYLDESISDYEEGDVLTTFNGGTYHINGGAMGIVAPAMTVTGGSILVNSMYQDIYKTAPLVPTKADGKTPLYLTTASLEGVTSSQKLTSLTTSDAAYRTNDIYTDASGKIYLYLPVRASVTGAKIGSTEYKGTVTATIEGAVGVLKKQASITTPQVKKNQSYTVSGNKYKVTNANTNGTGTVTLTSTTKNKAKMTSYSIPATVKIYGKTFQVTAIGDKMFKNCKKLKKVTIGSNVKTIGKEAFYGCKNLKTITIKSKKLTKVNKNAIKNIYKKAKIKVPSSKVKAYKKLFKTSTGFKKTMKITK